MNLIYTTRLLAVAVLLLSILLLPMAAYATHVRAGEVTTKRLPGSSLTYQITLTAYFDEIKGQRASMDANTTAFCMGDGTVLSVPRTVVRRFINSATSYNTYVTTYTFAGPGVYKISAQIINRNADTRNLGGAASDNYAFSVNTTIVVNAALGLNSNPTLLNPPLDSARVGQKFCHNPAAYDPDGDSLAYRLSIPETSVANSACNAYVHPAYSSVLGGGFSVSNEAGTGVATFTVDKFGNVCWDAPGQPGQYNIAFIIEEWRDGVLIGEVTRDMQIFVVDATNKRPLLNVPPDVCVQAGATVKQTITATDPDNNRVTITAFGGVFNKSPDGIALVAPNLLVAPLSASFTTPTQPQPTSPSATGTFNWVTNCGHVRVAPYEVVFRVIDSPGTGRTGLSSTGSFNVTVISAAPQNLTVRPGQTGSGRSIQLNWSAYACYSDTNTRLVIYRRTGCENDKIPDCTTGIPAGKGYVEIGRVKPTATSFLDTVGIQRGVAYNYRVVAAYPRPISGYSVASVGACLTLALQAPIMTNVTVDSTNTTKGVITVRWSRPIGLKAGSLNPPYQYRLLRADPTAPSSVSIAAIATNLLPTAADTVYTNRGLNTTANQYTYLVEFYYTDSLSKQLTRFAISDPATSVRLTTTGSQKQVVLTWQAQTPWTNDNQKHRVYRSTKGMNGPFNQIAEVSVGGAATYRYADTGADTYLADGNTSLIPSTDSSYCYRVVTVGQYTDPKYNVGLLVNYSQIACASPIDTARPCAISLSLDTLACANLSPTSGCNASGFTNTLKWNTGIMAGCDPNIASYNIYYSRYSDQPTNTKLTSVPSPTSTFQHQNLTSVAGCYVVTAVNKKGIESLASNKICKDVCPYFALPNVFTPNGDGKNDLFKPLDCPRGLQTVDFLVYNRYGAKIFQTTDLGINWNGNTSSGQPLPSGTYYYEVTVSFSTLQRTSPPVTYKGWIELLR